MPSLATWFTPSLQTISRSSGRSAVAASAYRACTLIYDERTGITHDFTPKAKNGLVKNICVGIKDNDIAAFWNNAERAENRANSTVARELMLPLADDWTDEQNEKCVLEIAQMLNQKYHVGVQASIHKAPPTRKSTPTQHLLISPTSKNKHVHMMFSTREIDEYNYPNGGFGKKTRILDDLKTGEVKRLRETVAEIVNRHAQQNGNDWFVTAGKYAEHIKDHVPTHHISVNHGKKQKEYIDLNRAEVKEARNEISRLQRQIDDIDEKIEALQQPPELTYQELLDKLNTPEGIEAAEAAEQVTDWTAYMQDESLQNVLGDPPITDEDVCEGLVPAPSTINNPHTKNSQKTISTKKTISTEIDDTYGT